IQMKTLLTKLGLLVLVGFFYPLHVRAQEFNPDKLYQIISPSGLAIDNKLSEMDGDKVYLAPLKKQ
ncbi:MAG: hypothetical protein LIO97_03340, partial [Tannerellaceae bacterium]|nr:hypothetical protein [Tannerellaceae bacterium]